MVTEIVERPHHGFGIAVDAAAQGNEANRPGGWKNAGSMRGSRGTLDHFRRIASAAKSASRSCGVDRERRFGVRRELASSGRHVQRYLRGRRSALTAAAGSR